MQGCTTVESRAGPQRLWGALGPAHLQVADLACSAWNFVLATCGYHINDACSEVGEERTEGMASGFGRRIRHLHQTGMKRVAPSNTLHAKASTTNVVAV